MFNSKIAYDYLLQAKKFNDGEWIQHSIFVGIAAKRISENLPNLNSDLAEAYGYIHDIGRRFGRMQIKHSLLGYSFLNAEGLTDFSHICLTHSFPTHNVEDMVGEWDCTKQEYLFIKDYIHSSTYTIYDKLIQLCDAIAIPSGFTILEKRLVDVSIRYGIDEKTLPRWKSFFQLKKDFDNALGYSIYKLFPEIKDTIF